MKKKLYEKENIMKIIKKEKPQSKEKQNCMKIIKEHHTKIV